MGVPSGSPDGHKRLQKLRRWWSGWRRRIVVGDTDEIQGALENLGYTLSRGTIAILLKEHGIEPAPERNRKTTWTEFSKRHWEQIVAADFFTIEVWTPTGLQRYLILFFIDLSTRRVEVGGIARVVNGLWMSQVARNLTDAVDGFLKGKRYLIHDRDPLFTREFQSILADAGVESVKLPPRAPNLNSYAERFVRSIKEECLERMILFGEDSLRDSTRAFLEHYHGERNHQGLGNRMITPLQTESATNGVIVRRDRLGGMLNYYYREAVVRHCCLVDTAEADEFPAYIRFERDPADSGPAWDLDGVEVTITPGSAKFGRLGNSTGQHLWLGDNMGKVCYLRKL
jgi:putative transposase